MKTTHIKTAVVAIAMILIIVIIVMIFNTGQTEQAREVTSTESEGVTRPIHRDEKEHPLSKKNRVDKKRPTMEEEIAQAICSTVAWNDKDKQWIKSHHTGVHFVREREKPLKWVIKKISKNEIPHGMIAPRSLLELKTIGYPLRVQNKTNRHKIMRDISLAYQKKDEIWHETISLTIPRAANPSGYGLVFQRNEDPVSKIGIIMPILDKPVYGNPDLLYGIEIRYNDKPTDGYVKKDVLLLPKIKLTDKYIVLLGDDSHFNKTVHVKWLEIEKNGGFRVLRE